MARNRTRPEVVAEHGDLVVLRDPDRPSGRLLRQRDMDASYVDLADVSHLEFDYLRWMRAALRAVGARRNLHIGGGACALPRALAAEDPEGLQVVCEVDPEVLELARRHLGLRRTPGLRVRRIDGREFLAGRPDHSFDTVVIDAFEGATIPARLVSHEALLDAARVAPVTLVNVVDDRTARVVSKVAATLAAVHPGVWWVAGRGGNTLLLAGNVLPADRRRISQRLAADPSPANMSRA